MCRIILSRTNNHAFAEADTSRKHKLRQRGDVIEILDDGVSPGTKVENNPRFMIIDIPGVPKRRLSRLLEASDDSEVKEFRFSLSILRNFVTAEQRTAIQNGSPIIITQEVLGNALQKRRDRSSHNLRTIVRST